MFYFIICNMQIVFILLSDKVCFMKGGRYENRSDITRFLVISLEVL